MVKSHLTVPYKDKDKLYLNQVYINTDLYIIIQNNLQYKNTFVYLSVKLPYNAVSLI